MVNVYYIQNQFIPYHQLEFIKPLGEGMFGDVWHAKYSGKDVAIKRAKVAKKYRKIMYAVYLHEAQLMRFVFSILVISFFNLLKQLFYYFILIILLIY